MNPDMNLFKTIHSGFIFLFVMQALQPGMPHLSVHGKEKFGVVFGVFDAFLHFGHGFDGVHLGDVVSKHPHSLQCDVIMQQIVSSCGRCGEVDCGEDSFVGETAFELEFHVARAFELFKDDFVHFGAGVNERGGNDGE